jgi:RNA polymerase sigma factor (sigma-70 family)
MSCAIHSVGEPFSPRPPAGMTWLMDGRLDAQDLDERRQQLVWLLAAIDGGDRRALQTLYERTRGKLYGICLRVLGDEADAQDVLQDVFTTIWAKAGRFDAAKASAITWLSVLARNRAIDRLRARREPAAPLDQAAEVASGEPSQLEVLEQAQDRDRLMNCLDELDERARTMIRSAFLDGASYPELAQRAEVPLPTMKSWIRRGLQRLRGCLDR